MEYIRENEEKYNITKSRLEKFNRQYFPILLKELQIYKEIERKDALSEANEKTKKSIKKFVKKISQVLEHIEENIRSDISMDVASDIQAAIKMMEQDGLIVMGDSFMEMKEEC